MRKAKPPARTDAAIGRDARRLLAALAADSAAPGRTDLRDGFVVVVAPRNGVISIIANAPLAAGEELVAAGLARRILANSDRRLQILPEGGALARRLAASADPFAAQHRSLVVKAIQPGDAPLMFDERESPLAWLGRRAGKDGAALLTSAQLAAGERFGRDVTIAQILPRVTADWSGAPASGGRGPDALSVSDLAIAARQRLDRAAGAVGSELNGLLIDVCGFQKALGLVERERAWPARAAKVVLKIALDRLAAHYGLSSEARGPERGGKLRRWGTQDYRPAIDPPE